MKKLVLIRHGKSNWDFPIRDHDRPLKKRGVADVHLISEELKQYLLEKFLIFSSTAKRAIDTAKIFAEILLIPDELIIKDVKLYAFDHKTLEMYIKSLPNQTNCVIIFAHNNAITDFVNKFGDIYIANVPTAGGVILEFEQTSWSEIKNGKVLKTIFPKDLKNEAKASKPLY
nr:phosphoglycerate mutase family protein [uncultured Flavobacterium sp.]